MNDLTWCCSPDCEVKCERHITNYPVKDTSELVSIADFSGMCQERISHVLESRKRTAGILESRGRNGEKL